MYTQTIAATLNTDTINNMDCSSFRLLNLYVCGVVVQFYIYFILSKLLSIRATVTTQNVHMRAMFPN